MQFTQILSFSFEKKKLLFWDRPIKKSVKIYAKFFISEVKNIKIRVPLLFFEFYVSVFVWD